MNELSGLKDRCKVPLNLSNECHILKLSQKCVMQNKKCHLCSLKSHPGYRFHHIKYPVKKEAHKTRSERMTEN